MRETALVSERTRDEERTGWNRAARRLRGGDRDQTSCLAEAADLWRPGGEGLTWDKLSDGAARTWTALGPGRNGCLKFHIKLTR